MVGRPCHNTVARSPLLWHGLLTVPPIRSQVSSLSDVKRRGEGQRDLRSVKVGWSGDHATTRAKTIAPTRPPRGLPRWFNGFGATLVNRTDLMDRTDRRAVSEIWPWQTRRPREESIRRRFLARQT